MPNFENITAIYERFLAQGKAPGLAWGIILDGELVEARGLGVQNIETATPVAPDSVFRIASMTKSTTGMCILRLRDAGLLALDKPAAEYVPELARLAPPPDSPVITVRHLLTMSAGFPEDNPWGDRQLGITEDELTAFMESGIPFSTIPGSTFEYSNYNFAILGRIVKNVTGGRVQEYATEHIFGPLGMTSTVWELPEAFRPRFAQGHHKDEETWILQTPERDGAFAPMGGLYTTIPDWAKYMRFLLSAARPEYTAGIDAPISLAALREMTGPGRLSGAVNYRATPDAEQLTTIGTYGFGLSHNIDSRLGVSLSHGGGLPGYGTFYRVLPEHGAGVVAFTNATYAGAGGLVADTFVELRKGDQLGPRRKPTPDAALLEMQGKITMLYNDWSDALADDIAADNLFKDDSREWWQAQIGKVRDAVGQGKSITEIDPENALRGRWRMLCERGWVEAYITLAPTIPPKVQDLKFTFAKPPEAHLRNAIRALIRLINYWDVARVRDCFGGAFSMAQVKRLCSALHAQYELLNLTDFLECDGSTTAKIKLSSERGQIDARLTLHPRTHKIQTLEFTRPRETTWLP